MSSSQVVTIAKQLIACPSITPADAGAQDYLAGFLSGMGFEIHKLQFGDVPNFFARLGQGRPHLCYAGHTDVVPPGPEDQWTYGAFNPVIEDGVLYGRGASDMKGSVAAFAAAAAVYVERHGKLQNGSISMLITGDEEGPAIDGTVKVLEWMNENGHCPDVALVGEPSNPAYLGQEIKIGRRGSYNATITVRGKQGHTAYPGRADNPLPGLIYLLQTLVQHKFDQGSDFFPPTGLQITSIDVGNTAYNVIPASAQAKFNIRFSDIWTRDTIDLEVRKILDQCGASYELDAHCNAESFLTRPGEWSALVQQAVADITGRMPAPTTFGGTSDARFMVRYCPVVECGAVNASIHQIDENAKISDLEDLTRIYTRIIERYFASETGEEPQTAPED